MFKIIVTISVGYLLYRVAKNGIKLAISNRLKPKELHDADDLIKCEHCEGFMTKSVAFSHKKKYFCSQDCLQAYFNDKA